MEQATNATADVTAPSQTRRWGAALLPRPPGGTLAPPPAGSAAPASLPPLPGRPMLHPRALTRPLAAATAAVALAAAPLAAQVTTGSLAGRLATASGGPPPAATVTAVHEASGTTYRATARADGRFLIPGMRVGGPYTLTVRALGYAPVTRENLTVELGNQTDLALTLQTAAVALSTVQITATTGTLSSARTGAATRVSGEALTTFPTISRTIADFTRLTPQASGSSFAGQDNRLNNITIDGAFFNNSFGLAGQPGGRTNVAPIPLEAIEQIQINIAPFDVRQGNFVGAGVNAVTKSGTNSWEGSAYYSTQNESYVGTKAAGLAFSPGTFSFGLKGGSLSGPIIKNRLFFFANVEDDSRTDPGTTFLPNTGGQPVAGSVTRVLESDLKKVSEYLATNFNYNTGPYVGYSNLTPSRRYLAKVDFNANDANKLSVRYSFLNSSTDQLVSNSTSLGFGNRRTNANSFSFQNSGYSILENIRSVVGEWNAQLKGGRMSNNFIAGYTSNDESRGYKGEIFPAVDILQNGTTYMNFGFEPFTPNNELRYKTFQLQDNFSLYTSKHDVTFGATYEKYNSENVFYSGSQSVYTYNSLDDFFADANGYLANPNRTTAPVSLRTFQVRYNNIPGLDKPLQPLEVHSFGGYAQDQWRATTNLQLTFGLRVDVPVFRNTAFLNTAVEAMSFRDADGNAAKYSSKTMPKANPLWSPRLGFNWDVRGDRSTQLRGGSGIFSGRPPYVWISNQIGQNGILTGFDQITNTTTRPFNPNPDRYKPTTVTGAPASSYELDVTDPDFRFPQTWRSDVALDQKLPWGVIGTAEFIYGRDVNGTSYVNANLPAAQSRFTGADQRPRWTSNRINAPLTGAFVLENQAVGYNWTASASLEKSFSGGFYAKAAYNYGVARNTIDPGSVAQGTWTSNPIAGDPNNPAVSFSATSPGHRAFLAASYRREYFKFGATSLSIFAESRTIGNASYVVSGDLNGDGGTSNDAVYIPRTPAEMNFVQFTTGTAAAGTLKTFTVQQQRDAFEAYIQQDAYLRAHRGEYAERGAVFLPLVNRVDLSLAQDVFRPVFGKRNNLQIRLDVLNFGNLLNDKWGVGQRVVQTQLLTNPGVDASGAATYRLAVVSNELLPAQTYQTTSGLTDVYRMQLGVRYSFR